MKKIVLYMLGVLMILACGCGKDVVTESVGAADEAEPAVGMMNPWVDCSMDEIADKYGFWMIAPEGATNVVYQMNETDGLCQMFFNYGDPELEYTYRMQNTASFEDISGMYYEWDSVDETPLGSYDAKLMKSTASGDNAEVCLWFDKDAGVMYSLSTAAENLEGLDLASLAMNFAYPMEAESSEFIPANFLEDKLKKDSFDSFDEIISALDEGNAYALVKVYGLDEDVLIIAEGAYDNGDGTMAAIDGSVYRNADGKVVNIGNVFSGGTAYPISLDKDGMIYTGGHHQINVDCISEENVALMSKVYAYETFDENGNATYGGYVRESNKVFDEETQIEENDSSVLEKYFEEYANATVVNFTVK